MSGIYILGMEMPKSCRYCAFRHMSITENAFCTAAHETINYMDERTKRLPGCPLIPVPEHGRLIDASEKIRVQMYDDMTEDYHIAEMTIDDLLSQGWVEADAPTIIPASEEGEG